MNTARYKALADLRLDAIERGLNELAIVYGWSLVRLADESLGEKLVQFVRAYRA